MKKILPADRGNRTRHGFDQWVHDLDFLFHTAMQTDSFVSALKAKELIAKANGWLTPHTLKDGKPLSMVSNHDIDQMIQHLEQCVDPSGVSSDTDV